MVLCWKRSSAPGSLDEAFPSLGGRPAGLGCCVGEKSESGADGSARMMAVLGGDGLAAGETAPRRRHRRHDHCRGLGAERLCSLEEHLGACLSSPSAPGIVTS